ncbi:MAG: hypothetical protein AAF416_22705 [Pseudomonadota bacterium]
MANATMGSTRRLNRWRAQLTVGWSMSDSLKKGLAIDGMRVALQNRSPAPGLICHPDHGVQSASGDYCKVLAAHDAEASMSGKGRCLDKPPMEVRRGARTRGARRGSLKTEMVHRAHFPPDATQKPHSANTSRSSTNDSKDTPASAT